MPVAVAILGIAGAFATTSMASNKASVNVWGHKFTSSAVPCAEIKMCQTENNGILCRVDDVDDTSLQLKGKISPTVCPTTLYRIL
mgnify:FL=1